MSNLMLQLSDAVSFIQNITDKKPKVGIILGSGLGNLVSELNVINSIPYSDIPNFPISTVEGHSGKLLIAELSGKVVLVMSGRFHFYEGYSAQQVVFPVRVMKMLGIETILLSNAAGSVNASHSVGDLMIIKDHISLFVTNPLLGVNEDFLGTRFPDMSEPYDKGLINLVKEIGTNLNYDIKEGVYCGVTGPTFETRAEYKLIKNIGADVVGMSTVQETIAAVHAGMKVFAISVVTDLGVREIDNTITHEEVLMAAKEAEPKLTNIFKDLVKQL